MILFSDSESDSCSDSESFDDVYDLGFPLNSGGFDCDNRGDDVFALAVCLALKAIADEAFKSETESLKEVDLVSSDGI